MPGRRWRLRGRPFLVDVLAGLVVLVAATAVTGTQGYFFIDEAALLGQVRLLDEGEWTTPRPLPELDPAGDLVPMARSYVTGDAYAPFAKHPVHVVLAAIGDDLGGRAGIRALSVLGVLGAAAAAWQLARAVSLAAARIGFWITLLVSPLAFDAHLLVAHAPATGVVGGTFVAVDRLARWRRAVVVAVLVALGALLRSEVVLLGGAIGAVLGVRGVRRRSGADLGAAAAAVAGAVGAYVGEPLLVRTLAGGSATTMQTTGAAAGGLGSVVSTSRAALLGVLEGPHGEVSTGLLFVVLGAVAGAVLWLRRRPSDPGPAALLGGVATVAAALFVARPTIASGLLVAFPLVFAVLLGTRPPADARWRLQAVALFGFAVLLLQYEDVGGLEWGWRYFAVALVPVCAQIGVAADAGWQRNRGAGRTALALVVIASFLVMVGGLREQRRFLGNTAAFERAAGDLLDEPADWIVSADASFGRFAHELSLGREVLTLPGDGTPDVLGELASSGADRVLLVWRDDRPDLDLGPFVLVGSPSDIASGYRWQPLRREDR